MQLAFGSGLLFGTPLTDQNGNAIANPTPVLLGALQDCSVDVSFDAKEAYGSNNFPLDVARGKGKISGKAKSLAVSVASLNSLIFGGTVQTGIIAINHDLTGSVIPGTPFAVTPAPPSSGTFDHDLGVRDSTGKPYTRVASAPTTGQYSVSTGVYTFAAADTGKTVYIDYTYTAASDGNKLLVTNQLMGEIPSFLGELYLKKGGKGTYVKLFQMYSNKWSLPTKQDDYVIQDWDFSASADANGNVIQLSATE